jgi:hypothetical protein
MVRIVILFAVVLLAACTVVNDAPRPAPRPAEMSIEQIEVVVQESHPVRVVAHVKGWLGDGCTTLAPITQSRSENVIRVQIEAVRANAEICSTIAPVVDAQIELEGAFPPGEYTLEILGDRITFTV